VSAVFVEGQADGAIPNGSRIRKCAGDEGDTHRIGAEGTVRSSIDATIDGEYVVAYFIEWDDHPGIPVVTIGWKIEPADVA
jgi:hypothetical protein